MDHYIAEPKADKAPGIVLIQEIFGINKPMRSIADTWAEEGFLVMAPDLFWRLKPGIDLGYDKESWKMAMQYYQAFDVEQGVLDIGTTIEKIRKHPTCNGKVYVMGFCLGGLLTYLSAAKYDVDGAVCFYGVNIDEHLDKKVECPIIFHFGLNDEFVSTNRIEKVKEAYPGKVFVYKETSHGFYNRDRVEYNAKAAQEAHKRSLDLLRLLS